MTKKKYIKDAEGNVRGINTSYLQLEKPLLNENYDINIQNSNMDKIDKGYKDLNNKIDTTKNELDKKIEDVQNGLDSINLNASNINYNKNECSNVDGALDKLFQSDSDNKTSILQQGKDISAIQKELGINKETLIANTIEIFNLY